MKLNASNEGPTTHTQRVQFSTVKWTEGCTREASLSFEDSRWSRKITISERIGLLNGSRKSINEADKVVATTTLRLLTYLSTLELLLIFQFNRRYFARGRVDYNTCKIILQRSNDVHLLFLIMSRLGATTLVSNIVRGLNNAALDELL